MAQGWGWKLADLGLRLYKEGLLGGLPAAVNKARLEMIQGKQSGLEQLGQIRARPTWSKLPPGMEREAAGGLLPGQRREEMVGPTLGELGTLADIVKDLPMSQLTTAKAGPELQRPWLEKLYDPETVKKMVGGDMFPTEELRKLQQYEGFIQKHERPREIEIREEEVKEPSEPLLPKSFTGILPEQRKAVIDTAKRAFGFKEKEKADPTGFKATGGWIWNPKTGELEREIPSEEEEFTLGPGQKRFRGGKGNCGS